MKTEPEDKPESQKTLFVCMLKRVCSLSASDDDLFTVLLPASFVVLVVLAFFGRAAEMAVVAGFSGVCMAFLKLEKFSEFSGIGFSAKLRDVQKKLEALEVRETEVDIDSEIGRGTQLGAITTLQVSHQEKKALEAIENGKFTFRTATGIAKTLGLTQTATRNLMVTLEEKELVSKIVTSRRTVAWNITAKGREYLANTMRDSLNYSLVRNSISGEVQ